MTGYAIDFCIKHGAEYFYIPKKAILRTLLPDRRLIYNL